MQLELKPANKVTYKLKLTPHIRLAINLLQMPLVKLKEFIKQQAEENPLLELVPSKPKDSFSEADTYSFGDEEKKNYAESLITKPVTLQEHLLRQLYLFTSSDEKREIGELIIANIDDNGYLGCSVTELVEYVKADTFNVEKVLSLIHSFDPIGVGARNLRECLLLQLKMRGEENSLLWQIIDKYLPYLEKKRFEFIAKKLKVSIERIKEAMKEIAHLEPKPGRSLKAERTVCLIPDAIVRKNEQGYEVILNDWELPCVSLNDNYIQMLKQKDAPEDAKEYLRERLKAARSLIDAINKRKETIQKVIEEIVDVQKDFFDNAATNLKPMTLEQIAKRVGKHKSTISRTVTGKYLQAPWGIFELRYFLNSGIKQENGEYISSKTIKSKMADLIANENKENPLTDQNITQHLKREGMFVARRTIAKYRNQLKILSSQSRRG